jgi:hypothetical protein
MRLPTRKIWRAFPELDRFPDARCARYVREAKARRWVSGAATALLIPVFVIVWLVSVVFSIGLMDLLHPGGAGPGVWGTLLAFALFAGTPLLLALTLLLIRDRWLHGAIRARLNVARCLGCSYSLLGLEPGGNRFVVCPECGKTADLTDEMLEQMRELGASTP